MAADVADVEQVRTALAEAGRELGDLDAVVANAGAGAYGPFAVTEPDVHRRTFETTLLARLGWRKRERQPAQPSDTLSRPDGGGDTDGGLASRPSALQALRDRMTSGR